MNVMFPTFAKIRELLRAADLASKTRDFEAAYRFLDAARQMLDAYQNLPTDKEKTDQDEVETKKAQS